MARRTHLVAVAFSLLLTPAAAEVLQSGTPHYQPLRTPSDTSRFDNRGTLPRDDGPNSPTCYDSTGKVVPCVLDMQYWGGPVLSNVKVYAVFWTGAVSADVVGGIGGFYQAATNSEWVDWLAEYSTTLATQAGSHLGQPGTQQVVGRGTFAGGYALLVLSKDYPACASPTQNLTCVHDVDIQKELDWQITHGYVPPPDENTLYVVHFPASVSVQDPMSVACKDFCAYHSSYAGTYGSGTVQNVAYAVLPDLGSNGCQNGCGPGTTFQNTCLASSHEVAESITDSAVGQVGASADYPLGWYSSASSLSSEEGEIGDMCDQYGDFIDQSGLPCIPTGENSCYPVQQLFSQVLWSADPADQPKTPACVTTRFATDDYSIALGPNTLTLAPGTTAQPIPVLTVVTNGSPLPLALSLTAVPPGLHASLDTTSLTAGSTAHLTVSADANAGFRDGVLVVQATGTATHSASLLVQLTSVNDWTLFFTPSSSIVLFSGETQTVTVEGRVTLGTAEPVALSVLTSNLPPGVTASVSPATLTPGVSTAVLTLSAAASAPGAAHASLLLRGVSASQVHNASLNVQVDNPPSVSITSPAEGATVQGATPVNVTATPGVNAGIQRITIAVDALPPLASGYQSSISWDTRGVPNGSHTLNVVVLGTDGATASASVHVSVNNPASDFTLQVTPQSLEVPVGGSAQLTVTTTALGEAEPISLTLAGLPSGVNLSSGSTLVTAGASTVLTLAASTTAAAPLSAATLTGTTASQPNGHSVALSVGVSSAAATSKGGCAATGTASGTPWLLPLVAAALRRKKTPHRGRPAR